MGFDAEGVGYMSLAEALQQAERKAMKSKEALNLDKVLDIALMEAQASHVREAWQQVVDDREDMLDPSRKLADLVAIESDDVQPQAVGHALVQACRQGFLICVRRLREIQSEHCSGSLLVALFNAFGLLKAAEAGHVEVVQEILRPMVSGSTAMMGFILATRWRDKDGAEAYPFVAEPENPPSRDWILKLDSSKTMLPPALPNFQVGWDLRGMSASHENMHEVVRASYKTYLLWRISVIAASQCHTEVFRILLKRRWIDNLFLKETLSFFFDSAGENGDSGLDHEAKKIIAERAKMDTLMYQLVEEYSTKNYHDPMLYTLWKCCVSKQTKDVGKPKCKAEAFNGMWEVKLEVPLLMMPVEHAATDEEPKDRYKQLTLLYAQTAQLSIQLLASCVAHTDFLQVSVGVKHVRFKSENSRWDDACMGHFPSGVRVSVLPLTNEGSSVTLTNSSSNTEYTVGRGENFSMGSSGAVAGKAGFGAGFSGGAGQVSSILMKSKPWRFEQVPLQDDDRGGSFKWTLQAMKGVPFDKANPIRMAESNSMWKWGRRVASNPLDELPFTSEGGVQFTGNEFSDTMMWRFPKTREGTKLRWRIEGEVYLTYTTARYFETRTAQFCSEIDEPLKAAKPNFETRMNNFQEEVSELLGLAPKDAPKIKPQNEPSLTKFNTTVKKQFLEWLEFRKELDAMQAGKPADETGSIKEESPQKEDLIEVGAVEELEEVEEAKTRVEETVLKAKLKPELKPSSPVKELENHGSPSRPCLLRLRASKNSEEKDLEAENVREETKTQAIEVTEDYNKPNPRRFHRRGLSYTYNSPDELPPQASSAPSHRRGSSYSHLSPDEAPLVTSVSPQRRGLPQPSSQSRRRETETQVVETRTQVVAATEEQASVVYLTRNAWSVRQGAMDANQSNTPLSPPGGLSPPKEFCPAARESISNRRAPVEAPQESSSSSHRRGSRYDYRAPAEEVHGSEMSSAPSLSRLTASKGKFRY